MSDKYEQVRSLSFPALSGVLGIDMARFKRRKQDWQGYCPIHQSKSNNNCFAYADDGKFHCFSCGAKGRGAIDLAMQVKDIGFQAAVELLGAAPAQTPAPAAKAVPEGNSDVLRPLEKDTWKKFQVPCEWLEKRIPDAGVRERYQVFCYSNPARRSAYSGRVMIPVRDIQGNLFGYLGRAVETEAGNNPTSGLPSQKQDTPKYLFPKNLPKSHFLFGAHELVSCTAGRLPLKCVYLVESPFCVMKFAMYGLPAVAAYGWSVSDEQIQLLQRLAKGIVYLPDRNKASESAGQIAKLAAVLWVRFPPLPENCLDPEQMTKEQILAL